MADTILCPNCQHEIRQTDALSEQVRGELTKKFEANLRQREQEFAERESQLTKREQEIEASKRSIDEAVEAKLATERERLADEARRTAAEEAAVELSDTKAALAASQAKLEEAKAAELDLRRKTRELDEQQKDFELTLARQLDDEREKIRAAAKQEAAEERALKEAEKDKLITDLRSQIDGLKRKSEQGSQQTQGEVLELNLEETLRRSFPTDDIVPVPKGVHGGDTLQAVCDGGAAECGLILWEYKSTKNWSDGWLPKLRDDQRAARAQVAILVTAELPKHIRTFGLVDGVWVTSRACALALATALRTGLVNVAAARRAVDGQHDKMEILYNYLASSQFKQRVEGIVEAFVTMREDLETEKRATNRAWAKREKQLERATVQTSGMYGDLSGIIGASLPAIETLGDAVAELPDAAPAPVAAELP